MTPPAADELRAVAHEYLERNWSIIPTNADKRPIDETGKLLSWHEFEFRRPTEEEIDRWFGAGSVATGIALICGVISGVAKLDVDVKDGGKGKTSLAKLGELPPGPIVATPTGGEHRDYRFLSALADSRNLDPFGFPGLEWRSNGNYCLLPPSWHAGAKARYRWLVGPDEALSDPPAALCTLLGADGQKPKRAPVISERVATGGRRPMLMSLAGTMRRRGMMEGGIRAALMVENRERCDPPVDDSEVDHIAKSVMRYAPADIDDTVIKVATEMTQMPDKSGGPAPLFANLRIVTTEPKTYRVGVRGKDVEVDSGQLNAFRDFQRQCIEQADTHPPTLKQTVWDKVLDELFANATHIEAPADIRTTYRIGSFLDSFVQFHATSTEIPSVDDLRTGTPQRSINEPVRDGNSVLLTSEALLVHVNQQFARSSGERVSDKRLFQALRDLEWKPVVRKILGQTRRFWLMPGQIKLLDDRGREADDATG